MRVNSIEEATALANSDPPLAFDDYNRLEQRASQEFRRFLIGLTCTLADRKCFQNAILNGSLTRAQLAKNSGYAENSMKRLVCYAAAIIYLQKNLPDLAIKILAGETKLGMKSTILLAKQPNDDIIAIMKRLETENLPISRIISEQIQRPLTYPRKFSGRRRPKETPKSIKDTPRYDPDSPINGLVYTIPTWARAINRFYLSDLSKASDHALNGLSRELENLRSVTVALIELITEA